MRGALIAALALGWAAPAAAYVPFTTEDGVPLHWTADTLRYRAAAELPADLLEADAERALTAAFEAWTTLPCHPLGLSFEGFVPGAAVTPTDGRITVAWIHDPSEWRQRYGATEIARTIVTSRVSTGVIIDADVVVNVGGFRFAAGETCTAEAYDLQGVLTHEVGHVIGLDHSAVAEATMFATSSPGDCHLRELHPDDVAGFCATYEPIGAPEPGPEPSPEPTPEGPLASEAVAEGDHPAARGDEGCAAGAAAPPWWLMLPLALGATRAGRRSPRRARAR